jgi:hypothetical protein
MPRWSKSYAMPGGGHAIVCGSGPTRKCSVCKTRPATQLCDFVVGHMVDADLNFDEVPGAKSEPATCDQPLCRSCSVKVGDRDLCPDHPKVKP